MTLLAVTVGAHAGPAPTQDYTVTITHQAFKPKTLTIPANKTVKILVDNRDALPAEFESNDFHREQVVPGGSTVPVYVGPLKPGTYTFFNDFHPSSTGTLVVRQSSP